jgi:membrane associated rhomboid family serine protease
MIPLKDDAPRFTVPFVTYALIAFCSLVFLYQVYVAMALGTRYEMALVYQFGFIPARLTGAVEGFPLPAQGALLTLFTSMFLHGSFGHLAGNMLFLWIFGDNIEDYLGHTTYLLLYLVSGVTAGLAHLLFNAGSVIPTVGASGAIAGVMGAYFVLYPSARVLMWFPPIFFFWIPAWVTLGLWFIKEFMAGAAGSIAPVASTGGVAVWAHVGGFVAGVIMIKLLPHRPRRYHYGGWE